MAPFAYFAATVGCTCNEMIVLVESSIGARTTVLATRSRNTNTKSEDADGWKHESIILKPLTTADGYLPIVLEEDELRDFRVIGVFVCTL